MAQLEKKIKHLEFIQLTITRMAANSFLIKAWSVTLVAALFALSVNGSRLFFAVAYLPLLSFWILDAYYLRQERLFRAIYNHVITLSESQITFSLDTRPFSNNIDSWHETVRSVTLEWFYGPILLVLLGITEYLLIQQLK